MFLLVNVCPAEAAIYRFTFASNSPTTITGSIELILSGLTVTGVANGTGFLTGAVLTGFNMNDTFYGIAPRLLSTSTPWYLSNTTEAAVGLKVGDSLVALRSTSLVIATDTGTTFIGYPLGVAGSGQTIDSQSLTPAPAPLPGAGWLSWLLVAGAAMYRKHKDAVAFIAARYSLVKRKIAGTAHASVASTAREGASARA